MKMLIGQGTSPMIKYLIVLIVGVIGGAASYAAPRDTIKPNQYVLCKNKGIVRTIRVETTQKGGCEAKYTKSGVDRIIGYGRQHNSCSKFLNNVKRNLIDAAWSCREISDSKITAEGSSVE